MTMTLSMASHKKYNLSASEGFMIFEEEAYNPFLK